MISRRHKTSGFTLVELLVVIVVIAILAVLTFVVYKSATSKAHASTLQSDLTQAATGLGILRTRNGAYPASQSSADLQASPGATYTYNVSGDDKSFCLQESGWSLSYYITDTDNRPLAGTCSGTSGTPDGGSVLAYTVTTFAGSTSGTGGHLDGTGTDALLNGPLGLVYDSAGNLYFTDYGSEVRKITPAGVVTTIAGSTSGTWGFQDGAGSTALFKRPYGLTIDSSGNLYVVDSGNNAIRKITPAGVVSTFAGSTSGTPGHANGTGTAATFYNPYGIVADSSNNLYVTDQQNNIIREITPAGVVTTFAGNVSLPGGFQDGTGTSAKFNQPGAIIIDNSGNLYVADSENDLIRKVTPGGVVTTIAGNSTSIGEGYANGAAASATFYSPNGLAFDSAGNLYIADTMNHVIRMLSPSGTVSTVAGPTSLGVMGYVDAVGAAARFDQPNSLAIDSAGNLYIADTANNVIRKMTLSN